VASRFRFQLPVEGLTDEAIAGLVGQSFDLNVRDRAGEVVQDLGMATAVDAGRDTHGAVWVEVESPVSLIFDGKESDAGAS